MNKKRLTSLLLSTALAFGTLGASIVPATSFVVSAADTQITEPLTAGIADFSVASSGNYGSWDPVTSTFTLNKNVEIGQYTGVSYKWLFSTWTDHQKATLDLNGNTLTVNSSLQTLYDLTITSSKDGGTIQSGSEYGVKNNDLTNPLDYGVVNNKNMGMLNVNSLLSNGYVFNKAGNAVPANANQEDTTSNAITTNDITNLTPASLTLQNISVTASGNAAFAVTVGRGDYDSWGTSNPVAYGSNLNTGKLTINNCQITAVGNVKGAVGVMGGAIGKYPTLFSTNDASVNIEGGSTITAGSGRALSIANSAGNTKVEISSSSLSNDSNAENSAIYFSGTGTGTFNNTKIEGSIAVINVFGNLTFKGSGTVVKSNASEPITGVGTVASEESFSPSAIVQITNTSKGNYPAENAPTPGVTIEAGNFWTSSTTSISSPLVAADYNQSLGSDEVVVTENTGTVLVQNGTSQTRPTSFSPIFNISGPAYFNKELVPGYLYKDGSLQWPYLIDSETASDTPSYQYSYSNDLKAAMQQVITAGQGEVSSAVTTDNSNTAVFEVNGRQVAKIAVDGTLDLPVNISVNNGSQQITGWTISSPAGLNSSISGNVLTWPTGISDSTITLIPVLSSTTTPGGGSNSGTTTPDQKPEESPTPSTPVDTPITDSGSNSDSFKPNSGVNAGVTGEGAGFTTNGSSTQTNETAKTETTFTQNENGTKAASTQNSTGEVTSSVITVPSSSIVNGEASVSLGSNSNTGQELFVVGNKTSETVAPSLTINLPSATTEATVNVTVENGTMKPGTVAMVEDSNGNLVPIPNTTTDGNTLSIPLTGSQKVVIMDNAKTFADTAGVPSYATNAAAYVSARDLMTGMGTAEPKPFSFDSNLTRGQFATILYRLEGEPKGSGTYPDGIIPGAWNADAARWAVQMGLMGQGGAAFNPQGDITREQIIAILWRLQNKPIVSDSKLDGYNDVDQIKSDDFKQAMAWAVSIGIVGQGTDNLDPNSDASRAEIAAMIQRYIQKIY